MINCFADKPYAMYIYVAIILFTEWNLMVLIWEQNVNKKKDICRKEKPRAWLFGLHSQEKYQYCWTDEERATEHLCEWIPRT